MSRRSRAQAHARRAHTCPRCGRTFHGNRYANHKRACHLHIRYAGNVAWCGVEIRGNTNTTDGETSAPAKDVCRRCVRRKTDNTPPHIPAPAGYSPLPQTSR